MGFPKSGDGVGVAKRRRRAAVWARWWGDGVAHASHQRGRGDGGTNNNRLSRQRQRKGVVQIGG